MDKLVKIVLLLIINCSLLINKGLAQNLVPNFGFEQNSNCPSTEDQVQFCDGWTKYSTGTSTPDYYNSCSSFFFSVPNNQAQFQLDHRNCGAYMGLATWTYNIVDYREHIGIQLSQPLIIGQKYYLSFYTVMAGQSNGTDYYDNPSNNIGMRLSTVAYSSTNPAPIDNFTHLRSVSIISDTANWVRISGSIIADSAYQYMILGNFYDDANTDTTTLTCSTCLNWYSYYLIDDVCISTDSNLCNGGIDILPCNVSIEENTLQSKINIYPNPANNYINIAKENDLNDLGITIYNSIGQILYNEQKIISNNKQIDISTFSSGLLFIKIESNKQQFIYKLLKQ